MSKWRKTELWRRRGQNFCVEVSHHTEPDCDNAFRREGPHRWCVYAYIYPAHWHFAAFNGDGIFQDAANALPLHGGASLLRWHCDTEGRPTSVQVGGDYNHDGDAQFTFDEIPEHASRVFYDAEQLYDWLEGEDPMDKEEAI